MKITIDTQHDSHNEIEHAIRLLSSFIRPHLEIPKELRKPVIHEPETRIQPDVSAEVSAAMNSLFRVPKSESSEEFNSLLSQIQDEIKIERY